MADQGGTVPISLAKPQLHPRTADRLAEAGQGFQRIADQFRAAAPQVQRNLSRIAASLQSVRETASS